ncbi:MAG: D-tyrosyl-tRNA(Tyr) deacylase, partial [Chlorobium sp.]
MRAVVQRVLSATVSACDDRYAAIGSGLLVLLGIAPADGDAEIGWMCRKIAGL